MTHNILLHTSPALSKSIMYWSDFILALIAKGAHEEGGYIDGPVTSAGVAAMGSRAASAYIDSLRGE